MSAQKLIQYSCDFYGNLLATQERLHQSEVGFVEGSFAQVFQDTEQGSWPKVRWIRTIFSMFKDRNNFGALEQFRNFIRRHCLVLWPEF
jgi:hypothetical protein